MWRSLRHLPEQHHVISSMIRAALQKKPDGTLLQVQVPGDWLESYVSAPHSGLVRDYLSFLSVPRTRYEDVVPPHLFPQWTFPFVSRVLGALPVKLTRIVNAGVSLSVHAPIPLGAKLQVRVRLASLEQRARHVLLTTDIETLHDGVLCLEAKQQSLVPVRRSGDLSAASRESFDKTIPYEGRPLATISFRAFDGAAFAALTGDINPIHWLGPYAKVSGFSRCISHGFATFARVFETLTLAKGSGLSNAIRMLELRFFRPVLLPSKSTLWATDQVVSLGGAPGALAQCAGRFLLNLD